MQTSLPLPSLSNFQLDALVARDSVLARSNYVPSCSKDRLLCGNGQWTVVNLGDESSGGSHWALLDRRGKVDLWVDSFGFQAPSIVRRRCRVSGKRFVWMHGDRQLLQSESCGWWCLVVERMLQMGDSVLKVQQDRFWVQEGGGALGPTINEIILRNYVTTWKWM